MDLEGKTCMVVGAGRGIGRRAAELFSDAGANLVLSSRTSTDLHELEYQLNSQGNSNVLSVSGNAAIMEDALAMATAATDRFGAIDYLVHSAGLGILKPFAELTSADLDLLLAANVRSAFNIFQAVLPTMSEQKFGRIVAFPGILGKAPMMQAAAYCASKYALTGMVKCLAQEYKRFGIRFSLMHLGGVDSSFWDDVTMRVDRTKMLSVDAAANAAFFAATQPGEGVMAEVVLMPESHQLV